MEITELNELLERAIQATRKYHDVMESKGPAPKPPVRPSKVEDPREWLDYQVAIEAYQRDKRERDTLVQEARKDYELMTSVWNKHLPAEVWFRHGNTGVGVAYTNWGGSSYYLKVAPWSDAMPSLDHRHYGD